MKERTRMTRRLRRDATEAERRLWNALREALPGRRFRRRHPIGRNIFDFACPSYQLALEIDGGQHAMNEPADIARTAEIARRGYRVLRFWNNEVMQNLPGVLQVIQQQLGDGLPSPPLGAEREGPAPTRPSPARGGGKGGGARVRWAPATAVAPPPHPGPLHPRGAERETNAGAPRMKRETRLIPSPPFRGEREGPGPQGWEGEVGAAACPAIPRLTPALSTPRGGEGDEPRVLAA